VNELTTALKSLPHGPEFRFVDRLLELNPGKSGVAEYTVRGDEPFLRGHFPGAPIFPGVLLIEAAAQLAGVIAQSDPNIAAMPGLKLTAVRNAKILGTAKPAETVRIEACIVGRLQNLVQANGKVFVNDRLVLSADLVLAGEEKLNA
jgi:3-hydroxyacyl-[acyl-carrier-protein] dehydratase